MKNSRTGGHDSTVVDYSHPLGRQTFANLMQPEGEECTFRFSNTSEPGALAIHYGDLPPSPLRTSCLYSPGMDHSPFRTSCPYSPAMDHSPFRTSSPTMDHSPTLSIPSFDLTSSPLSKSPWSSHVAEAPPPDQSYSFTGLMGSLVREEGHIYSLAAAGDLLYTGSESKNIRVWKNQKEFSSFKSNSGLVKAIIIAGDRIFSGHQDGKIRIWKASPKDPSFYKRIGNLPTFKAKIKSSFKPSNYVEVRKHRNAIWIKHTDAISCLSLSEDKSLLYSASWDRTFKVWRVADSKCLESVTAHDDAVNSIAAGFDGLVFTGSADGTVKVWRRQVQGKGTTKHFLSQTLLKQECAVTALAVDPTATFLYSGSSDGLVNFWERDKILRHGGVLRGHKLAVLCLATAGNLAFSGSADTHICVWRREEGTHICLSVLTGHRGPVKCLAVEEEKGPRRRGGDRHYIVYSGSIDKSVKIWRVSSMQPWTEEEEPAPQGQVDSFNAWQKFSLAHNLPTRDNNYRMSPLRN